jgi:regulator of cell morphogenesis and NO signaling
MTSIDRTATVAQIVTEHAVAARVFQKHGIDFCCRGGVTVAEACRDRAIEPAAVWAELEALPAEDRAAGEDPRRLSTAALLDLIVERHHGYLRRALPFVVPLASKVAEVHGDRNGKLVELRDVVAEIADALDPHLDQEERVLFPALLAPRPDAEVIRRELASMHVDHLAVGTLLARMRELSDGFTTPEWGCRSYRILMGELETLEGDVLRHVHLENHVLMPRFAGAVEAR